MRAAVIFGLGLESSRQRLKQFQKDSSAEWVEGVPAASGDADVILIFGGDGTIHRHLPALVRSQIPALIVPSGSGNDFARAFNLRSPDDYLRLWRKFEADEIQPQAVDLGVITPCASPERGHCFCSVAGCGLDADATRSANQMPRWLRGRGGYLLAALPLLAGMSGFPMRLTAFNAADRVVSEKPTLLAAFANTPFYGDGMCIAPQADCADGKLDICHVAAMNPFERFRFFPAVYAGKHLRSPKVEHSRAERVLIETETPRDIYADGEFVCQTPAEISIARGTLRLIAPPAC